MRAGSKSVVIDASVLLAFYLPAEPYKTQALVLLEEATLASSLTALALVLSSPARR